MLRRPVCLLGLSVWECSWWLLAIFGVLRGESGPTGNKFSHYNDDDIGIHSLHNCVCDVRGSGSRGDQQVMIYWSAASEIRTEGHDKAAPKTD